MFSYLLVHPTPSSTPTPLVFTSRWSSQELAGSDDISQPSIESSSPEQCLSKLTALIRVFTTVLVSLGTNFSPSRNAQITPGFVKEVGSFSGICGYLLIRKTASHHDSVRQADYSTSLWFEKLAVIERWPELNIVYNVRRILKYDCIQNLGKKVAWIMYGGRVVAFLQFP